MIPQSVRAVTATHAYDEAANLTLTANPNGTTETRSYDAAGRLSEVQHTKGAADFASFTYTRDAVGNVTNQRGHNLRW